MCSTNMENNKSITQEQILCFQMSKYSSSIKKAIEWLRLQYLLLSFLLMLLLLNFFQIAKCFAKHRFKLCSLLFDVEIYSAMSILCCSRLNLTVANCLYSIKFIHLLLFMCLRSSLSPCFISKQFGVRRFMLCAIFALFWLH